MCGAIPGHKLRIDIPCNYNSQSHTEFTRLVDCNEEFDVRIPFAYLTEMPFRIISPYLDSDGPDGALFLFVVLCLFLETSRVRVCENSISFPASGTVVGA